MNLSAQTNTLAQWLAGEPEAALRWIEAAISISPHDIDVMLNHGTILAYNEQHREGLNLIERVNRSEPRLPPGYRMVLSDARYLAGDYEGAVAAVRMIVSPPYYARLCMAASLAQASRIDEAKRAVIENAPANFDTARFARLCAASVHWSPIGDTSLRVFARRESLFDQVAQAAGWIAPYCRASAGSWKARRGQNGLAPSPMSGGDAMHLEGDVLATHRKGVLAMAARHMAVFGRRCGAAGSSQQQPAGRRS